MKRFLIAAAVITAYNAVIQFAVGYDYDSASYFIGVLAALTAVWIFNFDRIE